MCSQGSHYSHYRHCVPDRMRAYHRPHKFSGLTSYQHVLQCMHLHDPVYQVCFSVLHRRLMLQLSSVTACSWHVLFSVCAHCARAEDAYHAAVFMILERIHLTL
jgi:hypothetical protein